MKDGGLIFETRPLQKIPQQENGLVCSALRAEVGDVSLTLPQGQAADRIRLGKQKRQILQGIGRFNERQLKLIRRLAAHAMVG